MENKILTILTTTYNRGDQLTRLYDSLCEQSVKDFRWLIVDDGSEDNTKERVKGFIEEDKIPVKYIYKENGGKHTALNLGIEIIHTELTMIVDSDDWILPKAVEAIFDYHSKYSSRSDLCGYSFLRIFPDGQINGKKFPKDEWDISYITARINSGDIMADKAEVFYTRCLKEYPFPVYPGEKFLGEDVVWIQLGRKYKMIHINMGIYVSNYQENGLTKNRRKYNIASPCGCMKRASEYMKPDIRFLYRLRGALQYIVYGRFAGYRLYQLIKKSNYRFLTLLCVIPGELLYLKWKA